MIKQRRNAKIIPVDDIPGIKRRIDEQKIKDGIMELDRGMSALERVRKRIRQTSGVAFLTRTQKKEIVARRMRQIRKDREKKK